MSVDAENFPMLMALDTPAQLRALPEKQLKALCQELREYLLSTVSKSSGHLASGLGVIELTVALHYVFDTPFDQLIWDVGHQAYPHKILTGRRDCIHTIRQIGGLHPFPWREESPYDVLSVGHSSTSISAALGIALASARENKNRKVVAVIGDGAMTAGIAFEALNHAGALHEDLLIILNDNEMSISENVGALNNHLAKILSGRLYTRFREHGKRVISGMPSMKTFAKRAEEHLKGMISPGTLFEEFGFNYIGPIDGHDINVLLQTLQNMKSLKGPQLLHVMTRKGKGYLPAEEDPIGYHFVPKFNPIHQHLPKKQATSPTFSSIFGCWICDMAEQDERLVGITPAMREGSGLVEFSKQFADRYFDVAIAEQHAVTLAAGFAISGMRPVVAIYSTFMQRAYDQVIHDVALQNLPVLFAVDRAGIVGHDGPTHQGAFDLSFLRAIPNLTIMVPSDENECRQMLFTGYQLDTPAVVRYPRGEGIGAVTIHEMESLDLGKARVVREGQGKVAMLAFGPMVHLALEIATQWDATVVDMRFVKPLDTACIDRIVHQHTHIVTLEDNVIQGGAGSAVLEYLAICHQQRPTLLIGYPDHFITQGNVEAVYQSLDLTGPQIKQRVETFLNAV